MIDFWSRTVSRLAAFLGAEDVWRISLVLALPIPAIALFIGLALEGPSGQATVYDAWVYPSLAVLLLILHGLLLFRLASLQRVVLLVLTGACVFFFGKLVFLLYLAPEGTNILAEMTETFFWVPSVYVLASFVPKLRGGRTISFAFFGALSLVSLAYLLPSLAAGENYGVVYALSQLNLANLTFLALTEAFVRFKERFARAEAHAETMERLAHTDLLTGLPNRMQLEHDLNTALQDAKQQGSKLAVLFFDIDGFKLVNDTMGHERGDQLLRAIAERLASYGRTTDLLARISGDEFVLVVKNGRSSLEAMAVAERVRQELERPFFIGGQLVDVTVSVGVSVYPDDGNKVDMLLRHADSAMYQVKSSGKNGVKRYQAVVDAELEERKLIERDLRQALAREEFELYYQPIFELSSRRLRKLEALLRWQHAEKGLISPGTFIDIAESSGLVLSVGNWVLHEACRQMRDWQLAGLSDVKISVNVSPLQLIQADFKESVLDALEASGLEPHYLEIEITENVVMRNVDAVMRVLKALQDRGVAVAIDDFGTGYSSLSYLKDLTVETLKIDKSFVKDLASPRLSPQFSLALVNAIVSIAQTLDVEVVAEGIEHDTQFRMLREMGVELGQGYFFAAPVAAQELEPLLSRNTTMTFSGVPAAMKMLN